MELVIGAVIVVITEMETSESVIRKHVVLVNMPMGILVKIVSQHQRIVIIQLLDHVVGHAT